MKTVLIVGVGRFGRKMIETLNDLGIEISEAAPKPNIDAAMGWINRMV